LQDAEYERAGATLVDTSAAWAADVVLKVRPPCAEEEVPQMMPGATLVSYIQPAVNQDLVTALQEREISAIGATPGGQRSP